MAQRQDTWSTDGRSRRDFVKLSGAAALATSLGALRVSRAQAAQPLRWTDTPALHETTQYFFPRFLAPKYDMKFVDFGSSGFPAMAALIRRAVEGTTTANSYVATAADQGALLTAVCGIAGGGQAIIARADRGITRIEDLRGKKIVTKHFTSSHVMLITALRAVGIDPKKDVQIVDAGSPIGVLVELEKGNADAAHVWEAFASIGASKPGIFKLEPMRLFDLTWKTHSGTMVLQDLTIQQPELVQDIVNANVKAVEYAKKNRDEWVKVAMARMGQPREIIEKAMDNSFPRYEMDMNAFYKMADVMYELGLIKRNVTAEMQLAVNYTFLEKATGKSKEELGYVSFADYQKRKTS